MWVLGNKVCLLPCLLALIGTADPDQFIQLFVNSPEYLVQFLESVQEKGKATTLVYNTLLELYLRGDEEDTPTAKKERHDKALELLMNPQVAAPVPVLTLL